MSDLEDLQRKLAQRSAELERCNRELQTFARVASHDLREPVRKIASFCELLRETQGDRLDEEGRQFLGYIVDGAERMKGLISDLLSLSRVGSDCGPKETISLDAACDEAIYALADEVERSRATVEVHDLPRVEAHFPLMVLLFQHLIGNAIRFRGERDPEIRVDAAESGSEWTVSVHDNGIGIAKSELENVFTVFHRLHSRDEYPGTGIGLSICQKIVQKHGGSVWVESEPGVGSTFRFTLSRQTRP